MSDPSTSTLLHAAVASGRRPCRVAFLGRREYLDAWNLQNSLGQLRAENLVPDTLLLLEHSHTYTLGRRANPANILLSRAELERRGIAVFDVDRGGDVTYHGPGQLVGYPILMVEDRRDLLRYIRNLEEVLIRTLAGFDILSGRIQGLSGVWCGNKKVAAIGVKMGRVTTHGFALNVSTDMSLFDHIVPCGIRDKGVVSMRELLVSGSVPELIEVATVLTRHFEDVFDRKCQPWSGQIAAA